MKILFVNDDKKMLEFLITVSNKLEHDYKFALSGQEALQILKNENDFNAIVCNTEMHEMSGIDLLSLINTEHQEYPPFILLSEDMDSIDIKSISGNLYALLQKHEDFNELSNCLLEIEEGILRAEIEKKIQNDNK